MLLTNSPEYIDSFDGVPTPRKLMKQLIQTVAVRTARTSIQNAITHRLRDNHKKGFPRSPSIGIYVVFTEAPPISDNKKPSLLKKTEYLPNER